MNGYLVDTNVVSELTRRRPHPRVASFLAGTVDVWLSCVVIHELELGIRLLPSGRRRDLLDAAVNDLLAGFGSRVLPIDQTVGRQAARLRAQAQRSGRVLHLGDGLIAGTAVTHDLALATRNVGDFAGLDVRITNPWEDGARA